METDDIHIHKYWLIHVNGFFKTNVEQMLGAFKWEEDYNS